MIKDIEKCVETVRGICNPIQGADKEEGEGTGLMRSSDSPSERSPSKPSKSPPTKSKKENLEWSLQDIVQPDLPSNPDLVKVIFVKV